MASAAAQDRAHRLGIIGGGQLGTLLAERARPLGVETRVLTPGSTDPAQYTADLTDFATLNDEQAIAELIEWSDTITFELEAVPDVSLDAIERAVASGHLRVNPSVSVLRRLKDKGLQKTWLVESGLPTLPFTLTTADTQPDDVLSGSILPPLVQKARQGGYDGKGVQFLRDENALADMWPVPGLIEPALAAHQEVSVVIARDETGTRVAYPPVSMQFDDRFNSVLEVAMPAEASQAVCDDAMRIALDAVEALGSAGVFAVELFVTPEDEVLINEISPRVHNSGHLTMDAFAHDQFEQHVRAVTGLPLQQADALGAVSVMFNLLYDEPYAAAMDQQGPYSAPLGEATLHWYGKTSAKLGRKMGHINAVGDTLEQARQQIDAALAMLASGRVPENKHYLGKTSL